MSSSSQKLKILSAQSLEPLASEKEQLKSSASHPEQRAQKKVQRALEALNGFHIPAKMWAADLGIDEGYLRQMMRGDRPLSLPLAESILIKAPEILSQQQAAINNWLIRAYKDAYGTEQND